MPRTHTTLTLATLSLLLLAGCSSGAQEDAGTSASATATASPSASSVATPTIGADQRPAQLTPEEWEKYVAGDYVAATDKHPAFNVPQPVLPEVASQETFEGAQAFLGYWNEAMNYAVQTGDTKPVLDATDSSWQVRRDVINAIEDIYLQKGWIVGNAYILEVRDNQLVPTQPGKYELVAYFAREAGTVFDEYGNHHENVRASLRNNQPVMLWLTYKNGEWLFSDTSGIAGVDYGEE